MARRQRAQDNKIMNINTKEAIRAKAESLWDAMDNTERNAIGYGMFPTNKMLLVEEQGFDCYSIYLALMDCAAKEAQGCW
jgi:hypothetical protein